MSHKLSERIDEFWTIYYDGDENPVDGFDTVKLADEIRALETQLSEVKSEAENRRAWSRSWKRLCGLLDQRLRVAQRKIHNQKRSAQKLNRKQLTLKGDLRRANAIQSELEKSERIRERMTEAMVKIATSVGVDHHEFSYDELVAKVAELSDAETIGDKIEATLLAHKCTELRDIDDDPLPLVDALSSGTSIQGGKLEISIIVGDILYDLVFTIPTSYLDAPPDTYNGS